MVLYFLKVKIDGLIVRKYTAYRPLSDVLTWNGYLVIGTGSCWVKQ